MVEGISKVMEKIVLPQEDDDEIGPPPACQAPTDPPTDNQNAIVPVCDVIDAGDDLMSLHSGPPAEIFQVDCHGHFQKKR